jgi:hypothetical protein
MNAVTTVSGGGALVSFIERAAVDPNFDVGKFEALLRMQMEVEHDQARKAFNRAMAACQAEMEPVIRTAQNKHLGNKYAKLETIDRQMRPIYTRHGFSMRFGSAPSPREGDMRITCTVAHEAGFYEENYLDAPVSTTGTQGGRMAVTPVQAVGSNITYLRRYLSTMCFNMVLADDDDDDGESSRRQAAPARTWADDAPKRPYPERRMDPVDAMKRAEMARAEMDRVLDGDDIPAPVDKAQVGVQALEAQIRAAATEEELHAIAGSPQVEKQRAWLAKHRPELEELIAGALGERYQQLVQARLEAEVEVPEAATA